MDRLGGGQESEEVHSRKQQPPRAYERLVNKISDVGWAGTDGPDPSTSVSEIQLWLFFIPGQQEEVQERVWSSSPLGSLHSRG